MSTDIRSGIAIGVVALASGSAMGQPAAANAGDMLDDGRGSLTCVPLDAALQAMNGVMDRMDAVLAARATPRPSPLSSPAGKAGH